jgi:hypothetical protein
MCPGTEPAAAPEASPAPSGAGEVVIEVGGNIGAAAIFTAAELEGEEIEIRPVGAPWTGAHVAVRERRLPDGSRWAALFGALPEGDYEARLKEADGCPVVSLKIEGGRVASVEWPRA